MSENVADASFVYDEVAYPTPILPIQTPDQLAAALLMQGFVPPAAETASMLEIGCGTGFNLVGAAAVQPRGRYVGFDLSASAIAGGQKLVDASGLTNVSLLHGDILTWPRDGERFDYITCHGVYTWVPPHVRAATMELIGKLLAPGGVAYVGYDCLPATAAKQAINRFLVSETRTIADPVERVETAIALVAVLARHQLPPSRLKTQIDALLEDAPTYPRAYFFHDWLADSYSPVSIEEFAAAAAANGLSYAGDSALHDLYEGNLDPSAKALLAKTGDDRARRNSLLDLLRGSHMFRGDLLVRSDPPQPVESDPLARLSFAFPGQREEITGDDSTRGIKYARGESVFITATNPRQQKIMDALIEAFPGELTLGELAQRTGLPETAIRLNLHRVAVMGLVEIHTTPAPFTADPGERPRAGVLVRTMMKDSNSTISLRHKKFVTEQEPTRLLLTLCDGTRTRAEIAAEMTRTLGADVPLERVDAAIAEFSRQAIFEA